ARQTTLLPYTTLFRSRLRFRNTLEEDRVTPRGVRADEDHQLGEVEILVAKGNEILAERTLVAGHRRGHAQPRGSRSPLLRGSRRSEEHTSELQSRENL